MATSYVVMQCTTKYLERFSLHVFGIYNSPTYPFHYYSHLKEYYRKKDLEQNQTYLLMTAKYTGSQCNTLQAIYNLTRTMGYVALLGVFNHRHMTSSY